MECKSSITEKATNVFIHHPHLKRRRLRCRKVNQQLVIEGEVHSFFEKQLAQEALREIQGIGSVNNQIKVATP